MENGRVVELGEFLGLLVVVPLGLVITAIPILPGGVGTGHVAFSTFFQLFIIMYTVVISMMMITIIII